MADEKNAIDTFQPPTKEEEGSIIARPQLTRRKDAQSVEPPRDEQQPAKSGLDADRTGASASQDTPGRPKSASSRQQTQPAQGIQTGSKNLDAASAKKSR